MNRSPCRVQRQRTKGWRMPEGAVYVGRKTRWGNPFLWTSFGKALWDEGGNSQRAEAVDAYCWWVAQPEQAHLLNAARCQQRGKDLACWCPLDQPCHADVLLETANG
jgi:hypothetical protein